MGDLIGRTLAHFRIVEIIGAGGMGEVYRAHDQRLDRDVAIKVLPAPVTQEAERIARFEDEAKAVAKLEHPNILAIHEFGTDEGMPYAVMELLEGESLRVSISKGGVTRNKAVNYARVIADGLAAAHDKGIIHRDLKPENVFLTKDGRIKILDFGLAKLKSSDVDLKTETPTETIDTTPGSLIGTVAYMAPEQVKGQPADHRSDIFALGVVLYEMLTGRRPFGGSTSAETAAAILKEDPEPISAISPSVPPALATVVSKCLDKRPEDRFSSAHDLSLTLSAIESEALEPPVTPGSVLTRRWPHLLAVVVAVVIALFFVFPPEGLFDRLPQQPSDAAPPRIAVLPFENLGPPEDEYFTDGVAEDVRSKLAALPGLTVIASTSTSQYKGTDKSADEIGEELGVRFLLLAKVRWQHGDTGPSRIRVTPELVEVAASGAPTIRWQDSFDAVIDDTFRVQAGIATRVANALGLALAGDEQEQLAARPTTDLAAYDAFQRGRYTASDPHSSPLTNLRQAESQFQHAVELDFSFALAWAWLAFNRVTQYNDFTPTRVLADGAREAAERALELDPRLPEARLAMGAYYAHVVGDSRRASEEYALGLAASPNHPGLLNSSALCERYLGRWKDALVRFERASELDPRSPSIFGAWGRTLVWMRRLTEAMEVAIRGHALDPANASVLHLKVMIHAARGDLSGARAVVASARREVAFTFFIRSVAVYYELYWVLDASQQQLLMRSSREAATDVDWAAMALAVAHTHAMRDEMAEARGWAEEARRVFAADLTANPDASALYPHHGMALAYLGRRDEAVAEAERTLSLPEISGNNYHGPYQQFCVVRIYLILGEHERALDLLEPLLEMPFYLTPAWMRIDPMFDPLRDHPRFQALLEKYDTN